MKHISLYALLLSLMVISCTKEVSIIEKEVTIENFDFNLEIDNRSVLNDEAVAFLCSNDGLGIDFDIISNIDDIAFDDVLTWVDTDNMEEGDFFLLDLNAEGGINQRLFYAFVDLGEGAQLYINKQNAEASLVFEERSENRVAGTLMGTVVPIEGEEIESEFIATFDTENIGDCQ